MSDERDELQHSALDDFRQERIAVSIAYDNPLISEKTKGRILEAHSQRLASGYLRDFFPPEFSESDKDKFIDQALMTAALLSHEGKVTAYTLTQCHTELLERFEGVTVVQAHVLTAGYRPEDILALDAGEVERCYAVLSAMRGSQPPFDMLRNLARADIDTSLTTSFLGHNRFDMEDGGISL